MWFLAKTTFNQLHDKVITSLFFLRNTRHQSLNNINKYNPSATWCKINNSPSDQVIYGKGQVIFHGYSRFCLSWNEDGYMKPIY